MGSGGFAKAQSRDKKVDGAAIRGPPRQASGLLVAEEWASGGHPGPPEASLGATGGGKWAGGGRLFAILAILAAGD